MNLKKAIFFLIVSSILCDYIQVPIEEVDGYLGAEICVGSENQCMDAIISTSTCNSYIVDSLEVQGLDNQYSPKKSKTFNQLSTKTRNTDYKIIGQEIKGTLGEDEFYLNNKNIGKLEFFHAKEISSLKGIDALLGACYKSKVSSFHSVIDLFQPHQVMSVLENKILFGSLPELAITDYNNYARCNTLSNDETWQCNLRGILTLNLEEIKSNRIPEGAIKELSAPITFELAYQKSLVPLSLLLYLEKLYFHNLIENNDCTLGFKNEFFYIHCAKNEYEDLKDFSFILDDWQIVLSGEDLFVYNEEEEDFEFVLYSKLGSNEYIMGKNILRKFQVVFDKSNKNVGFYSSDKVNYIGKQSPQAPENYNKDLPIIDPVNPGKSSSGITRFFTFLGILFLVFLCLLLGFLVFRYFRRKRFPDKSFYYKATEEMFESGVEI